MNYYYLLIISKDKPIINSNYDYLWLSDDFSFIDECHIKVNDCEYEYTYLIYTNDLNVNYDNIDIMIEDNTPVTNYLGEVSIDNIFYLKKETFQEKLQRILEEK